MSLARAFTKRMRNQEEGATESSPSRSYSTRKMNKPIDRNQISLPVELISTSNALAYEAPDVRVMQEVIQEELQQQAHAETSPSSSASSTKSYSDSMGSPGLSSASSVTSHGDSRESSPVLMSPREEKTFFFDKDIASPIYFTEEPKPAPVAETETQTETPRIPQRALSHTKKTHEAAAARQRLSSPSPARQSNPPLTTRSSVDMFKAKPEADHPFGAELEKVNELAEEFGVKDVQILDDESQYLVDHGFQRFNAEEYMREIQPLFALHYPSEEVTWL